jgi:hypothetical protein
MDEAHRLGISNVCYRCRKPGAIDDLVYCFICRLLFHAACWPADPRHQDQFQEKCQAPTSLRTHIWVRVLLDSSTSPERQHQLHIDDLDTKWFGVPYQLSGTTRIIPRLMVWPRMNYLLQSHDRVRGEAQDITVERFPSLCSFFGETGVGKSTLIRALIKLRSRGSRLEVPVSGNDADSLRSTSGDVRLYADPSTIKTESPLLYAG